MRRFQLFSAFLIVFLFSANVFADTLVVTSNDDPGDGNCDATCTLREAITAVAPGDTITFSSFFNSPRTIALMNGQLSIGKNLTIQGTGANLLTVSGNNASRVFLLTSSNITVVISGMKITGGSVSNDDGGGIKINAGNLTLTDVIVTGNKATGSGFNFARGGGIAHTCCGNTLTINNSTISDNEVSGGVNTNAFGGGIFIQSGTFNGNRNTLNLNNSIIRGNTSTNIGGGIDNEGSMTITDSTISGNQNTGQNGGGINITTSGTTTINRSTISGNSSNGTGGGILLAQSAVTITNSTISGNTTVFGGGGIEKQFNNQTLTLTNVTITNNTATNAASTGGGLRGADSNINTRNSLFAGNIANSNPDVSATVASQGYNLVGKADGATGFTATGDQTGSVAMPLDAKLAPLGNYGGPTMTHALLKNSNPALNSPAIDTADTQNPPATDQRNVSRPLDGDNSGSAQADIGAFELQPAGNTATLPSVREDQQGYSVTIAEDNVQNGVAFTYCISSGQLPPGLSGVNQCPSFREMNADLSPQAPVVISGTPTQSGTYNFTIQASDASGNATGTAYTLNVLAPTAASVMVGGRVTTANGRGIQNVRVTISGADGEARSVLTGAFGYFRFAEVPVGETYVFEVFSKRFTFANSTQTRLIVEEIEDLNFIADN